MNNLFLPEREDFLTLGYDTERWLDTTAIQKRPVKENDCKATRYRQLATFVTEPRRYIRAIEVYGRFGGYIIHSSLTVIEPDSYSQIFPKTDAMIWNQSGGCLLQSHTFPRSDEFYEFDVLNEEDRRSSYASLSGALGNVITLSSAPGLMMVDSSTQHNSFVPSSS